MAVKSILLLPTSFVLRKEFDPYERRTGAKITNRKTGEVAYVGEVVAPGLLRSTFGLQLDDSPELIRLRIDGTQPTFPAGTVVRAEGRILATSWYTPRGAGQMAKSDLTITAERIVADTSGVAPAVRGGLAATFPEGMTAQCLSGGDVCDLMWPPDDIFTVDGLSAIHCTSPIPEDMVGKQVRPVNLRAFYSIPDRADVGQRSKAELYLVADGMELAQPPAPSNGKRPTAPVTVPDITPSNNEG